MRSSAARKREDDAQLNVWQFIAPASTGDDWEDLVQLMADMGRQRDAFGVTPGEAVYRWEQINKREFGDDPATPIKRDQRATSNLGRLGKAAGLRATREVRPSPVKRHHGHRHTVYVWPSIRDIQR